MCLTLCSFSFGELCSFSLGMLTISLVRSSSSAPDEDEDDTILRCLLDTEDSNFPRSILTISERFLFLGFPAELLDERLRLRTEGVASS